MLTSTVASIVCKHPRTASVFQDLGIDFCSRGGRTLAEACADRGLDAAVVVAELRRAATVASPADPRAWPTAELVGVVVAGQHADLRRTLPPLAELASKVARVHGGHDPRLVDVAATVAELAAALGPHLDREEQELFPALLGGAAGDLAAAQDDHRAVGALLERLRAATDDFEVPPWACRSYRKLLDELQALEADLLRLVYVEDQVLLPRFAGG